MSTVITDLAQRLAPSIVGLRDGGSRRSRGGSGVVVAPGIAVTLARNVGAEGDQLTLRAGDVERPATVRGRDATVDLAVLAFDDDLPAVTWAEAGAPLAIGAAVFALADPGGRGLRVTAGAVSSAPRAIRGPSGRLIEDVIEHTAPLPRGAGGGPLVDEHGAILGLNALRPSDGLLLAWPAAALRARAEALAAGRPTAPPTLGVALAGRRQSRRLRAAVGLAPVDGFLVGDVADGSPAAAAGLARGDVLVAVDGGELASLDALYAALDAARGATIALDVVRGSDRRTVTVDFGAGA